MSSEVLHKVCSICKESKSLDLFYPAKRYLYGKESRCIPCLKEYKKKFKKTDEAKIKAKERAKLYRKENSEKFKLSVKFSSYKKLGLTLTKEEYFKLLNNQNNKCAICGTEPIGFKKSLCLDHCHTTLKVRGFLCDNCNAGLGKFKDNIAFLESAIKYLKSNDNG
jgi:tRNA(Leu) C34 or U34 (ribose-2'-O)-methylase TrmL